MSSNAIRRQEYVERIQRMYLSGDGNAFEAFVAAYRESHPRSEGEGDLEYIQRCAEQDFNDGEMGGAVFQDVYDKLLVEI